MEKQNVEVTIMTSQIKTNIKWLPYIASDWKLGKVKQMFYISKELSYKENPTILSLARSGVKIRDISTNEGQLAASYDNYNSVKAGDLLLNPMDLYSGANCNVSNVEGVISPAYSNLRARVQLVPKFYDYYFKVQYWAMAMFAHGKGVSFDNRWTLNTETLLNYEIPVPSYEEQKEIATILDTKILQLDSLISNQEKQIEKLEDYKQAIITKAVTKGLNPDAKMKDSGVEWIGEIPVNSNIAKISKLYGITLGKMLQPKQNDDEDVYCNYLCAANIKWNGVETSNVKKMWFSQEELKKYELHEGDCLIMEGGNAGTSTLYHSEFSPCYFQNSINRATGINGNLNQYLVYWLSFVFHSGYIDAICNRATLKHYTKEKVEATPIVVRTIDEQKQIVSYLDYEINKTLKIQNMKLVKIKALKDYKKSIIYEYVTGKKRVE